ncbi:MAG TPA: hypothetical protein VK751_15470 [Undibacterium sp.]|nr:hypothetical protein [Undibacterium sp.]HTD05198.1 hypothetical protein [Undibacterium sp.]
MSSRTETAADVTAIEAVTVAAFSGAPHTSHTEPEYYNRFGFRAEPGLVLPDVPPEYFQAISFNSPLPCGTVSYDDSFSAQK